MDLIITTLAMVMLIVILQELVSNAKRKKLPPGPRGLPILGCLHLLGKFPHRSLHELAQRYGSIMSLRLGSVQAVVVSSPEAAELVLKTHDLNFASRPPHEASKYISYNQKNLTYAQYGPYWRNVRKMCTLELLSNVKINSFRSMRKEEVGLLVQYLKEASAQRLTVNITAKIFSLSAGMSCRMVVGKKYMDKEIDERGFKAVFQEALLLAVLPNLRDYIPWIVPLDLQGLTKRMKAVAKVFDTFLEKVIDEHTESKDQNETKDFVDVMLTFVGPKEAEYGIERDNVKAIVLDMLGGSMDTSAGVIDWALAELLKHPQVMKKVQKELEEKVGMNRMVEESDLESLEYLEMVIKETLRLHPVAPLLIPHVAMEDCTINGYLIPRHSRVFISNWALGRDSTVWNDADKYFPERFAGNSIDIYGQDFRFLPFGSGRRRCPGMQLGITVVRLVLAQLMHCFDWELPGNMLPADIDLTEEYALVMSRAKNLHAVPKYRLDL